MEESTQQSEINGPLNKIFSGKLAVLKSHVAA